MRQYIRGVIGCLLAGILLAMTACGVGQQVGESVTTTSDATNDSFSIQDVEICAFDQVRFEGDCHDTANLEEYLNQHLNDLLTDMSAHGITVDAYTEIRAVPIHIINLLTGTVGLHSHFLPVLERGAVVNAVSVNISNETLSVSATVSWPWMAKVDRVLKENPQETYLLTGCLIEGGNYICLISSQNEVIYIVRPANGGDLPFEKGVDYFSKLYDERLIVSHTRFYGAT